MNTNFTNIEVGDLKKNIQEWLEKQTTKGNTVQRLSEIIENPEIDFKVGDKVVYKKGKRTINRIIAISKENPFWEKYGSCIYIDCSTYFIPFNPKNLELLKDDE